MLTGLSEDTQRLVGAVGSQPSGCERLDAGVLRCLPWTARLLADTG